MCLWAHEIPDVSPDRLRIVIGELDALVDSPGVVAYLKECGVPDKAIKVVKNAHHGESLIRENEGLQEVLAIL
jgi:hypothetical protein